MNTLSISSRDNKINFNPGDTLEGNISWQLSAPIEALELRLIWFTSGQGDTDVSVENMQRFDAPSLTGDSTFRFTLPTAPHSFSGQLISLSWALELVVIPGTAASKWEFIMAPGGQEIILSQSIKPDLSQVPAWFKNKLIK